MKTEIIVFSIIELITILFYGLFTTYGTEVTATSSLEENSIQTYYPFYQDIHVMIFVGFGFLMTFLYKYSYSALGFTFLVAAYCIQLSILINAFFHQAFAGDFHKIELNIESLITGDFAAGAILISFGAVLGKITSTQLLTMATLELIFYAVNETIGVTQYEAVDMGGSMYVHSFGAYFGMTVAFMLNQLNENKDRSRVNNKAEKISDTSAMIGTLFLWMFWPSFNGGLASGNSQHRVVVNTVLALTASCFGAFMASSWVKGKYDMVHIQNATLAGGVAVGSSSDLVIGSHGAMIVGLVAGIISVMGYEYLSPWLQRNLNIEDTCGVHNLHGIPGLMGGIGGAISASAAGSSAYGDSIGDIFPARADDGRTASEQAWYQTAALFTTLGISILGGLFTGWILQNLQQPNEYYVDEEWELPSDEESGEHPKNISEAKSV